MSDIESFLGANYQGRRFLRVTELIEIGLIPNRQTLAVWIEQGHFPAPIRMGPRVLLFPVSEITETLVARAAERERKNTAHREDNPETTTPAGAKRNPGHRHSKPGSNSEVPHAYLIQGSGATAPR